MRREISIKAGIIASGRREREIAIARLFPLAMVYLPDAAPDTSGIGSRLESGERFEYAEVLRVMQGIWRETFLTKARDELIDA